MAYSVKEILRLNLLTILLLAGIIFGFVLGIILKAVRDEPYTSREISYINFTGEIFLRMLRVIILPLVVSSLITAIGTVDLRVSGKIGLRTLLYYLSTTLIAVFLGIILVTAIRPGVGATPSESSSVKPRVVTTTDTLLDLFRNMFPPNIVQACLEQYQTKLTPPDDHQAPDEVDDSQTPDPDVPDVPDPNPDVPDPNPDEVEEERRLKKSDAEDLYTWEVSGEYTSGINMLGLVVCSVAVGIALSITSEGKNLLNLFQEISQLSLKITGWIIWLSPIGIIFLICAKVVATNNASELFQQLGAYSGIVIFGVLFHGFVILPAIFYLFTRTNPYRFVANMGEAMVTAFGTASSAATLPVTIACVEKKNKVPISISRFVLPIGATINMDGTALYEAVAAIYIAQVRGLSLGFADLLAISITATAASIGAAAIPQAGLVTMVMVLHSVGLPAEDVALIIPVDWFLDRFRTTINVLGDSIGAGIISHLKNKEELTASG